MAKLLSRKSSTNQNGFTFSEWVPSTKGGTPPKVPGAYAREFFSGTPKKYGTLVTHVYTINRTGEQTFPASVAVTKDEKTGAVWVNDIAWIKGAHDCARLLANWLFKQLQGSIQLRVTCDAPNEEKKDPSDNDWTLTILIDTLKSLRRQVTIKTIKFVGVDRNENGFEDQMVFEDGIVTTDAFSNTGERFITKEVSVDVPTK